jgi:hypothetical protein
VLKGEPIGSSSFSVPWGNSLSCGFSVAISAKGRVLATGCWSLHGEGKLNQVLVVDWEHGLPDSPGSWVMRGSAPLRDAATWSIQNIFFGFALSMSASGDTIAVGAPQIFYAQVLVFEFNGMEYELLGSALEDPSTGTSTFGSTFGDSVALAADGRTVVIGASDGQFDQYVDYYDDSGFAVVYTWDANTMAWMQKGSTQLGGFDSMDRHFGHSASISAAGDLVAVSSVHTGMAEERGYVKVFEFDSLVGEWVQRGETLHGLGEGDRFGHSVQLSHDGEWLVVGAMEHACEIQAQNGLVGC